MKSLSVLGLDIGSLNVKAAFQNAADGSTERFLVPNKGCPASAVVKVFEELRSRQRSSHIHLAVTGCGKDLFDPIDKVPLENEIIATARGASLSCPEAKDLVEVGAQFSKWMHVTSDGSISDYSTNDVCAAGSGSFLEQQASRLQISVQELGKLAGRARKGATVAGRCSVFAKSDMIHLQQKGTPLEEIAYGLCLAVARNFLAAILKGCRLEPPVAFLGGGAENPGLVRAFREILGLSQQELFIPEHFRYLGAVGALSRYYSTTEGAVLKEVEDALKRSVIDRDNSGRSQRLPPLVVSVRTNCQPEPRGQGDRQQKVFLGVDVGSVSTNLVLITANRELIDTVYLPTKGRPIDVLREGLKQIRTRYGDELDVLSVGTTGSGRYLAARLLGVDTVKNEITAQLTSAAAYCPDVDTVFEIGGQDSKFISAKSGQISDFTMNKVCAAGTGSFLEEQSERLGIDIIRDFARHAFESRSPIDLGTRCTVFMDTELVNSLHRGLPLFDITAGLAYSIARNYLEKVVGNRPLGQRIVFQGGVASNEAVVAAFEALLNRELTVHPYNRVSGAIGVAILAADEYERMPEASHFRGWRACDDYQVKSFECPLCANRCEVNRYRVGDNTVFFGDACERYSGSEETQSRPSFPDLFGEREEAIQAGLATSEAPSRRGVVGIPNASLLLDSMPLWIEFFQQLGFEVRLSSPSSPELFAGGLRRLPVEICLPIKLAFGHIEDLVEKGVDYVFLPSLHQLPFRETPDEDNLPCLYGEYLSDITRGSTGRFLSPKFDLDDDLEGLSRKLGSLGEEIGSTSDMLREAIATGWERNEQVQRAFETRGKKVLESASDRVYVVLGHPYNLYDPFQNLNLAKHLQKLQAPVIPLNYLPLRDVSLGTGWDDLVWKYGRDCIRAAYLIRERSHLFPIVVSSFGCGPDGFTSKHLEELFQGRPTLFLEFDEHRGEAGLITRLEAFGDEVEAYLQGGGHEEGAAILCRSNDGPLNKDMTIFIPYLGDHVYALSGALQAAGFDARVLPPPGPKASLSGQQIGSGRECHPWTLMAGDLAELTESGQARDGDAFFFPTMRHFSCLLSQFAAGYQHSIERLNGPELKIVALPMSAIFKMLGFSLGVQLWQGLLAVDLLSKLVCHVRPYESLPGETDEINQQNLSEIESGMVARTLSSSLERCLNRFRAVEVDRGLERPKIGVAGDIYTRINPFSNENLFLRLEAMGCEVWPSPFMVDSIDFAVDRDFSEAKRLTSKWTRWLVRLTKDLSGKRVLDHLTEALPNLREPSFEEVLDLAAPYVDRDSTFVLTLNIAKMVDFARKGADGVVNAMGLNCMLGTLSAALLRRIREDHENLPMTSLIYGEMDSRSQHSRLEAFVHQVKSHAGREGHWGRIL